MCFILDYNTSNESKLDFCIEPLLSPQIYQQNCHSVLAVPTAVLCWFETPYLLIICNNESLRFIHLLQIQ